ncbi:MAG: precorrin-3B C(17)-methyltransferase [Nitrospirae bacterium]|nr:precorrin-3B C(17)-methyltransferase [Nitrospirota bacterium]
MSSGSNKTPHAGSVAIFYITDRGRGLAERLAGYYPAAETKKYSARFPSQLWKKDNTLVFIMASGIVIRTIAPYMKDKKSDPAVIVMDEKAQHVISLLSGHLGKANQKAREIAGFLGGEAVITTASDLNNLPSIDLWAEANNLVIENWDMLSKVGTKLINRGTLSVYDEIGIILPPEFKRVDDLSHADLLVTNNIYDIDINSCGLSFPLAGNLSAKAAGKDAGQAGMTKQGKINCDTSGKLILRLKNLVLGIGCNSGTSEQEIESAVIKTLADHNLSFLSLHSLSTIDIKKNEPGLVSFAAKFGLDLQTFGADELNTVKGVTPSPAAKRATGAQAVAEPSALLAAGGRTLLVPKQKIGNVTVAVAKKTERRRKMEYGKIFIVGTGPGSIDHITPYAQKAIRGSDSIVGYGTYLDLIQDLIADKEVVATGMTQEIDRCRKAIELSSDGRTVAVISGGDPGIYAMAGLVLELLKNQHSESGTRSPEIEVIPGISALNACASRLGAPLMHDFASISLSDRLTQWETIEKRLYAAAMADFVIALYNPKSKGRTEHISRARQIILQYRSPDTPVGIVRAAMRENESVIITDLEHMLEHDIDMQTTVIIGNSKTLTWNNLMITPRGYEKKHQFRTNE